MELDGGGGRFCSGMPGNDVGWMLGAMTAVSCLTWNVRGLNDQRKVRHVSAYIQRHRIDVCLLQETHLEAQTMKRLRAGWIGVCHGAVFSRYARGVAILLRKGLQWRTHRVIVDPNGRYVLLGGTLLDRPCRLVSVYGPNVDDPGFF
ncbi:hypothetical protein NDU88_001416 [Pleurodeles waltl]|uniref:exodeoxyribonuclease III n=1 Tax=Pleurodeles waltl TaxID=8319 RepID=A0AAV7VBU3_PLEWA|nr:hypothetical protein NDU88_001416 [Pleurodeles waltl]